MTVTAFTGPLVVSGPAPRNTQGYPPDSNPDLATSLIYAGSGILDPRIGYGNGADTQLAYGFLGNTRIEALNCQPATLSTTAVAASQTPVAGTALTLVAASGAGVTVLAAAYTFPNNVVVPAGSLCIDVVPAVVTQSQSGAVNIYNPATLLQRALTVTSAGVDTSATFLISGYDSYGQAMSQLLTGGSGAAATTTKTFKFITSIVPAGTLSGSAVTAGTTDVFEFPIRVDLWGFAEIYWNDALITATTGFTAAVTTDPATTTTGDVRGKYAVQASAADGTKRLVFLISPQAANVGTATGLFGVTQA